MAPDRWRVTIRAEDIELRGYVDGTATLVRLAEAVEDLGAMVVHSPAARAYNPFTRWDEDVDRGERL